VAQGRRVNVPRPVACWLATTQGVGVPPIAQGYDSMLQLLEASGMDLRAWAVAWARALPAVALVPAFGLRATPIPVRAAVALLLAASVAPALRPVAAAELWWPMLLLGEAARGLPVALTAALALWAATMAGGLIDNLRDGREQSSLPNVEPMSTPTGTLLSMLVAVAFLQGGGPARIAAALAAPELQIVGPLTMAVHSLSAGIGLAVAVAAPLVVASILFEVAAALAARAAAPTLISSLAAPLRSLAVLAVTALLLERMLGLLVGATRAAL
jgi:flagellar biosynthetic protein FliR